MSYTVLYRKYRPQTFGDLVGQEHVSRTLANAIEADRVAHAFLFTGARGVGKTTTARLLAKALNCEKGPSTEPCNSCDACREVALGTDLDVLEIDGASNNSVDDVRRLQESLPFRPARDRFKIVIVDEVHMLSSGAFNAFLKTLEEPPPHVKFIFATTEIHKVPITIRSRCQRYDFRLIPHSVVAARVRAILAAEGIPADDDAIAIVVREAAGSLRDALTLLDQLLAFAGDGLRGEEVARGLGIADQRSVFAAALAVLTGDAGACVRAVAQLTEQGLDMLHFARQLVSLVRDLVVLRVVGAESAHVEQSADELRRCREIAVAHSPQHLERTFAGLAKLVDEVGQSQHPALVLEMGLVRLADRPPLEPLAELLGRLQALEERLGGRGAAKSPGSTGGGGPTRPGPREANETPREPGRSAPEPRRGAPSPSHRSEPPHPAESSVGTIRSPVSAQGKPAARTPVAAGVDDGGGDAPSIWREILAAVQEGQPALGAVLEHAVPARVDADKIRLAFPEGSFFGKQAASEQARRALAEAAERILGRKPAIDIAFGSDSARATVAEVDSARRSEQHQEAVKAALNHPRVKDAIEVFPEAEGHLDVQVED